MARVFTTCGISVYLYLFCVLTKRIWALSHFFLLTVSTCSFLPSVLFYCFFFFIVTSFIFSVVLDLLVFFIFHTLNCRLLDLSCFIFILRVIAVIRPVGVSIQNQRED